MSTFVESLIEDLSFLLHKARISFPHVTIASFLKVMATGQRVFQIITRGEPS